MSAKIHCLTVEIKSPLSCTLLVFLEEPLSRDSVITRIEEALRAEYRQISNVKSWCFHWDDQTPLPGMFCACRDVGLNDWLVTKAAQAYGW